jgi:hypothetical protein
MAYALMVKSACDSMPLQVTGNLAVIKSNAVNVVSHGGGLMHFLHVAVEMTNNSH